MPVKHRPFIESGKHFLQMNVLHGCVSVAAVCAVAVLLGACEHRPGETRGAVNIGSIRPEIPYLFLVYFPGYPGPQDPVMPRLIAAVWQDGRVLRATSTNVIRKSFRRGNLSPDQHKEFLGNIEMIVLFSTKEQGEGDDMVPLHAASERLYLHTSGGVIERVSSFGEREDTLIRDIKEYLMSLPLADEENANNEAWRAIPNDWYEHQ